MSERIPNCQKCGLALVRNGFLGMWGHDGECAGCDANGLTDADRRAQMHAETAMPIARRHAR
jgi:hypothetical protein